MEPLKLNIEPQALVPKSLNRKFIPHGGLEQKLYKIKNGYNQFWEP
jgi:hypothetical protein